MMCNSLCYLYQYQFVLLHVLAHWRYSVFYATGYNIMASTIAMIMMTMIMTPY